MATKIHTLGLDGATDMESLTRVAGHQWRYVPNCGPRTVQELAELAAKYGVAILMPDGMAQPQVWTKPTTDAHDGDAASRAGG